MMEDVKKNRNVTVYDICMYRSCNHGRYTTGHHLYRFPDGRKNPELMREWVSRSGNKIRLRHWTASSIRNAGLCPDHFEAEMFQENRRIMPNVVRKLKKNAVPRKFEKPKEVSKVCSISVDPSTIAQLLNEENLRVNDREAENSNEMDDKKIDKQEKDNRVHLLHISVERATMNEDKSATVAKINNNENVNSMGNNENESTEHCLSEPLEIEQLNVHTEEKLTFPESDGDMELSHVESPSEVLSELPIETAAVPIEIDILKRENESLRTELKFAKEKCSSLQQQLQRARTSRNNYRSAVQYYKHESIDQFLNRRNCTNPVARAMIKLQLHKSKVEYTPDEKELVKDIFYHSISAFKYLRKSGCKMPGESTVKRWIQESDETYDYSNYILPDEDDEEYMRTEELSLEDELDQKEEKT